MLERVPIRIKLVASFAIAMAVLAGVGGVAIHRAVASSIDRSIDQGLRSRIDDLASATDATNTIPDRTLTSEETSFAQVVAADGTLLESSERFAGESVLTPKQVESALKQPLKFTRDDDGTSQAVRVLAASSTRDGRPVVAIVGTALDTRNQTLSDLDTWLAIGAIGGTVLATLLGYVISARALGAVDRIRISASQIDQDSLGNRLPLPPARDELRDLTLTLNDLLDRVDEAFERERRFVGDASHELRTPLARITAELELATMQPHDARDLDSARDTIQRLEARIASATEEAHELNKLAGSLLLLASHDGERRTAADRSATRTTTMVDDILDRIVTRYHREVAATGRALVHDAGDAVNAPVLVDELRIEQAIGNLIENAIRHGHGTIHVSASITPDDLVAIHVRDEGDGIPASLRDAAFDRFTRGDHARAEVPGAGLGLSIVAAVAEAHGGTAIVDSDGFVTIQLPRAA